MRVADYIWKFLSDRGVRHVFLVTGGGAMYLNDALGREKRIKYVCNLHEQACAMAAEGVDYRVVGSLDNTDTIMNSSLWIGLYPGMGDAKLGYMIEKVRGFCDKTA